MAGHHQLLYHIVFSVKERRPLLRKDSLREEMWAYMAGVCKNLDGFALRIGGYYDHAHLLVRIPTKVAVADFVGAVKANTSKHFNGVNPTPCRFHWQDGYGAFSVSTSQKDEVARYIDHQLEHHSQVTFQEEYLKFLELHEIEYDSKYLWE